MLKQRTLTEDSFETLLGWLAPEREAAGEIYEEMRRRLVRIFQMRGCCHEAEALADETIARVAGKVPEIADSYRSESPANYFYGVAHIVFLEWRGKNPKTVELTPLHAVAYLQSALESESQEALRRQCMEKCLSGLDEDERRLVFEYYKTGETSRNRQKLAAEQNITIGNLRVRAYRLRERLEACFQACLKKSEKK